MVVNLTFSYKKEQTFETRNAGEGKNFGNLRRKPDYFQLGVETNIMCQRKFFIHQICLFLFLLTATLITAQAQVDTASITGQVTDAQGAVVGGARIVTNQATNISVEATTNDEGFASLDMAVHRRFGLWNEDTNLELRWEVFYALNRANFGLPNRTVNGGGFGTITTLQGDPRIMQFALRFNF